MDKFIHWYNPNNDKIYHTLKALLYEPYLLSYQLVQMTLWPVTGPTIWLCNSNFLEGTNEIFPVRQSTVYSPANCDNIQGHKEDIL